MNQFDLLFERQLQALEQHNLRRSLQIADTGPATRNFCSNDYLGLSGHPALIARSRRYAQDYGVGSKASRLLSGTLALHRDIESRLARAKGAEAALLFASGWQANASLIPALIDALGRDTRVYVDRLVHASLHQGCRAAAVHQHRFRHNDLNHLETLLRAHQGQPGRALIITESVFSMDGDCCPVEALTALARRHAAFVYLDEAHATGVLGPAGMGLGTLAEGGVHLSMGTCSKAMGSFGAYVAGSRALCDYLVNRCSGFSHTTALPPPVLGAIEAALELIPGMQAERAHLHAQSARLRQRLHALGLDTGASSTQIIPVLIRDTPRTLALQRHLHAHRMQVGAIRPPTVPSGTSRLRITLTASHTAADIDDLSEQIRVGLDHPHLLPASA